MNWRPLLNLDIWTVAWLLAYPLGFSFCPNWRSTINDFSLTRFAYRVRNRVSECPVLSGSKTILLLEQRCSLIVRGNHSFLTTSTVILFWEFYLVKLNSSESFLELYDQNDVPVLVQFLYGMPNVGFLSHIASVLIILRCNILR